MDESLLGKRNKRGDWSPNASIEYPPLFIWPPRPVALLKWCAGLPGYLLPWNLLFFVLSALTYLFLTPSTESTKTFSLGWMFVILVRNLLFVSIFCGGIHFLLYIKRMQGTRFKFNARWPDVDNSTFLFRHQVQDNMFWTLTSGVTIWTAYEAFMLWMFSNGYARSVAWSEHPYYCSMLALLIPLWRDIHFFAIHRLLHVPLLYRLFHKLHHNNVNILPWSGLAMHPIEHVLYFSVVLILLVVPSNPLLAIFILLHATLGAVQSHVGFWKVEARGLSVHNGLYSHYLHHKYFECNYADGTVPLDKWFGTFHDGSADAQSRMDARFLARAERANRAAKVPPHRTS